MTRDGPGERPADKSGVSATGGGVAAGGDIRDSLIITGHHNTIFTGRKVMIPGPEAVQRHREALRILLEAEARERWGAMGSYIHEEGTRLPIQASPYQIGPNERREDLLTRMRDARRLLVLGEPGSGKTVALQRLAWELCYGGQPVIPVIVPLLLYAGRPLETWVRSLLQSTGALRLDDDLALTAFLRRGGVRCLFLFDGLNEVSRAHRNSLVEALVLWASAYPEHGTIITARPQDDLWRPLREPMGQTWVIQPITDPQITAYLKGGLGEERGQALFERLDERLRALARRPLLLWLMKEAAREGEALPGNRGELYARFVSRLLRRDTERSLDAQLPERTKLQAAACLGYALHRRYTLACERAEAVDIVAQAVGTEQAEDVLGALARHGLLIGEEQIRFPHQTLQEHFAAVHLSLRCGNMLGQPGLATLMDRVRQRLASRPDDLSVLARDSWWSETFIQLAGLVENPDELARGVARVNPWLAWWCVQEGRPPSELTRVLIEERSIRLLHSARPVDRRRAVQALAQIGSERSIEMLFSAAGDVEREVSALAVGVLVRREASYRSRLTPYVSALIDQPLAYVPSGPFLMGSDPRADASAYPEEEPQHTVELPGYWIGRQPVTVAAFRWFVEQSRYKPRNPHNSRLASDHPATELTWHDALAYCLWLSDRTGLHVTLPSEAEWEKAARGTDGRLYPWGNEPPDETRCKFHGAQGRSTTAVGHFSPAGDSPHGCQDMAGNVWEWTRSLHRAYPYIPNDGRENLDAGVDVFRVVRGGSFYLEWGVRCACRLRLHPVGRLNYLGFRVVVVPIASGL